MELEVPVYKNLLFCFQIHHLNTNFKSKKKMDFFAIKINTLFNRFDMDRNGKIEEEDLARWSDALISIGKIFINFEVNKLICNWLIMIRAYEW